MVLNLTVQVLSWAIRSPTNFLALGRPDSGPHKRRNRAKRKDHKCLCTVRVRERGWGDNEQGKTDVRACVVVSSREVEYVLAHECTRSRMHVAVHLIRQSIYCLG